MQTVSAMEAELPPKRFGAFSSPVLFLTCSVRHQQLSKGRPRGSSTSLLARWPDSNPKPSKLAVGGRLTSQEVLGHGEHWMENQARTQSVS